jgi:hypothetical protein
MGRAAREKGKRGEREAAAELGTLLGVQARDVSQQRHGQDRTAPTEQPQRDADEDGERDGQPEHGQAAASRFARAATMACGLQDGPRL